MLHSASEVFRALSRCPSPVVVGFKVCVISMSVLLLASGCARMLSWGVFVSHGTSCAMLFTLFFVVSSGFFAVITGCGVVAHAYCVPRKCRSKSSPVISRHHRELSRFRVQTCTSRGVCVFCLVTPGERIFLLFRRLIQDGEIQSRLAQKRSSRESKSETSLSQRRHY